MDEKPTISLVLIVRNEAHNIVQLLHELAPVYDEAIVVDTGSTDATVSLAAESGATVVHFAWCDDFAAARNFGIKAAGGHWILTLDADERLDASDFSALRQATTSSPNVGYFFKQRNYTDLFSHPEWRCIDGRYPQLESEMRGYIEAYQIRLFPNSPDIRYHGCIHEVVVGCQQTEHLDLTVHHFGHIQGGEVATRRNDLYSRLTREKWRKNPADSDACFQMATRYLEEGRPDLAQPVLENLMTTGQADHPAITRCVLALGRILQHKGDAEASIEKFELAVQQKPEWLMCWIEALSALVEAGRWSDVAKYLKGAGILFEDEPLLWRFECRLMIATGEFQAAAEKAEALVQQFPRWDGARRLAVLCRQLVEKNL